MAYRKKKEDNELILNHNVRYDYSRTIEYFIHMILQKFKQYDKIIIVTKMESLPLVNTAINESRHMGYQQGERLTKTSVDNYGNEIEQIIIPLQLISAVKDLKKDKGRKFYD